jgi:hypothetical protein
MPRSPIPVTMAINRLQTMHHIASIPVDYVPAPLRFLIMFLVFNSTYFMSKNVSNFASSSELFLQHAEGVLGLLIKLEFADVLLIS